MQNTKFQNLIKIKINPIKDRIDIFYPMGISQCQNKKICLKSINYQNKPKNVKTTPNMESMPSDWLLHGVWERHMKNDST